MELAPKQVTAVSLLPRKVYRNLHLAERLYEAIRAVNDAQQASFGGKVRVAKQESIAPLLRALENAAQHAKELREASEELRFVIRNTEVIEDGDRAARIEQEVNRLLRQAKDFQV